MARRHKNRKSHGGSVGEIFARAKREFEKGNYKEALKEAKICHRQKETPEHRQFLERVYLARAEKLLELGQRKDSIAVIQELQQLKPSLPEVHQKLPKLLIKLGIYRNENGPLGFEDPSQTGADQELQALVIDEAVLNEQTVQASSKETAKNAQRVRAALQCLAEGRDDEAAQQVKDLPRNTPWADWKLLVRGLNAYYRRDDEEMEACWKRLDPDRAPARIAGPLRALNASARPAESNGPNASGAPKGAAESSAIRAANISGLRKIERHVMGEPILARLAELREKLASENWKSTMAAFQRSAAPLRRYDVAILQQVTTVLMQPIIRQGVTFALSRLEKWGEPPAIDPRWNRAWGMMWEESRFDANKSDTHWRRYLDDLKAQNGVGSVFSKEDQSLAQSLVWSRLGDLQMRLRHMGYSSSFFDFREEFDEDRLDDLERKAVHCFRQSIQLAPKNPHGYERLAAAYEEMEDDDLAAKTYREMLEQTPHHLPALGFLVDFHQQRDEPDRALVHLEQIHQLKPLDQHTIDQLAHAHIGSARRCALRKEWDQGREHFTAAAEHSPSIGHEYSTLAKRAAFEFKAALAAGGPEGQDEQAEAFAKQAEEKLQEPTAALLDLAIESARYNLPRKLRQTFERRWNAALKKKCGSETAGQMCRSMAANWAAQLDYSGRSAHVRDVLAYVRRCTRFQWEEPHLRNVCLFVLSLGPTHSQLLERFLRKGLKVFPESPFFHYYSAAVEMANGSIRQSGNPLSTIRSIQNRFRKVLELIDSGLSAADAQLAVKAKRQLTALSEMERFYQFSPRSLFGGYYYDDYDDDEDDFF